MISIIPNSENVNNVLFTVSKEIFGKVSIILRYTSSAEGWVVSPSIASYTAVRWGVIFKPCSLHIAGKSK